MVKSMTGFGRSQYEDAKRNITVEIKSVNHRYSDINVRMPRRYSFAEEKIKNVVKNTARRGKIEVSIIVEPVGDADVDIKLNTALAGQYIENLKKLKEAFGLADEIRLEFVASLPDVMKSVPDVEDEEEISRILCEVTAKAAAAHDEMRRIEGEKLAEDIIMRGDLIQNLVKEIEERSPDVITEYADRLRSRITDMLQGNIVATEDRIMLEAAVFADKINVTEETVRLRSHIKQLNSIIGENGEPAGKKLDFLIQEMNREANTIGSKANDLEITSRVLTIKSEIEKIREQVQNIE